MSKKYYGCFTSDATKAIKNTNRLICTVTDDGDIYITTGYVMLKMNVLDYAAIVQPVSLCDAGNWSIDSNGRHDDNSFNAVKMWKDAVAAVEDAAEMQRCPLTFAPSKKGVPAQVSYYNAEKDFSAFYNATYAAATTGTTMKAPSAIAPAIAFSGSEPVALIMPVRPEPNAARAVKAYFTTDNNNAQPAGDTAAELDTIRAELDAARQQIAEQNKRIEEYTTARDAAELHAAELAAELEKLHNAAPVAESKPEPKTAAELIAARFADMAGVTATIKGAQTAAPVVWLTGDTEKHADAIKAAGAKWSSKKAAYYVKVAA